MLYPSLLALVVDRAPEAERGLAVGTLAGSYDLGVVTGSLLVGFVVERTSHAMGFIVGGLMAALGLATFLVTERRQAGLSVLPRPSPGV